MVNANFMTNWDESVGSFFKLDANRIVQEQASLHIDAVQWRNS